MKMPWDKKEEEKSSSIPELDIPAEEKKPEETKVTEVISPEAPTGTESPFSNPALEGMSEQDIADRLALLNSTVKEQGAALSESQRRLNASTEAPPAAAPDVPPTATQFWEDPAKEIKAMIQEQMEETIKPFRDDLQANKVTSAWSIMSSRHADFAEYKPLVETLLSRMGIAEPDEALLDMLYHTAIGLHSKTVGNLETPTAAATPAEENRRTPPPQHAPSSHPVASESEKGPSRELTESEREVAKLQGFKTDEEYLAWLEIDETQVLQEAKE
jgi:hypothetical protein